jgi:DNA repair exonuclease SbcCD ATPase subunit
LVNNPESAIRSLLDFVGEPYSAKCLEPLSERINSSNVPPDFKSENPATDPTVVERARRLYAQIEETGQPSEAHPEAAEEMEATFRERVKHKAALESIIAELQRQLERQNIGVEQLSEQLSQRTLETAKLERDLNAYAAELERHKAHLTRQEEHYTGEFEQLRDEIEKHKAHLARQEEHYTGEVEQLRAQLAEDKERIVKLKDRLRRQLWNTKKLSRLLDDAGTAAARLRKSRRWKLANPGTAIKAMLSHGKVSVGYDYLDKIVKSYSQWRASHPEVAKIDDEIKSV